MTTMLMKGEKLSGKCLSKVVSCSSTWIMVRKMIFMRMNLIVLRNQIKSSEESQALLFLRMLKMNKLRMSRSTRKLNIMLMISVTLE